MERGVPFRRRASNSIAASVIQFAVTGMVVVLLLGFAAVELLRHTGTSEAIRDAKQVTRLAGDAVVAPNVTAALERGDPKAIAAMDRIVHSGLLSNSVVRVKLWNTRGRIIYSDEHRLIGLTIPLKADELLTLRQGGVEAEVSNLSRPENRYERGYSKLLEVYLGVRAPSGQRLLFESYQRFSSISASGSRLWQRFLPALIGALVLLELAQIPLAWSLGRRLRRGQREREALLRRAIDASALERRRIAGDLHDGAVQNLAGVSYGLSAVAGTLPSDSEARTAVEKGASETRRTVRELRTLLVDIYPPVLRRSGLRAALSDLLDGFSALGLEVRLDASPDLLVAPEVEELLFRVAQEALRNVRRHADARAVEVRVEATAHSVLLEVSDDGRGFQPNGDNESNGHFGLRVVGDLVRDAGGDLEVISAVGEGTVVRVEMPRG
jgi:signal transduction histidine kinase